MCVLLTMGGLIFSPVFIIGLNSLSEMLLVIMAVDVKLDSEASERT